jgi:hypothetical protein
VRPHVPPHLWQPITWATALRAGWTDATPRWLRLLLAVAPSARALAHWLCEHRDPTEPRP